eukprot:TRINITY_DN16764_c0_g1_i1.p1 TRINITY_DN16764_c0_g1~~TRINITY_DN16764_c0_g1_i1.p1  ORF type:complete len:168 (-),score=14.87 TRINITY_DN16764_c0_g1_i1:47-550(-)
MTMEVIQREVLVVPALLLFISFLPFVQRQLKTSLQRPISRQVKQGLDTVLNLQKLRNPLLTKFVDFSAFSVSVIFYATFIPLLLFIGQIEFTVCLSALLAIQQYCGSFLKDLISAPRPLMIKDEDSNQKLERIKKNLSLIDENYSKEFGFPSTHTSQSIAVSWWHAS